MADSRTIQKALGGAEDLLFGQGTVAQTRNGKEVVVSKINADTIPYSGDDVTKDKVSIVEKINSLETEANLDARALFVSSVSELLAVDPTIETVVRTLNYHSDTEGGGGVFYWDATRDKADHNGGTVIDPSAVFPTDWTNQTQLTTWFTAGIGTGCWVRQYDGAVNVKWFGAIDNVAIDSFAPFQLSASSSESINVGDGDFLLSETLVMPIAKKFTGNGALSKIHTNAGFIGPIISIRPEAGEDPKGWDVSGFTVTNAGAADNVFLLDISAASRYISKLVISNIVSTSPVSQNFVELLNTTPNIDGLFTSVFKDNWSFGGYYMDNIGDSMAFIRNTTTGAGYGYYINQLDTASNIAIRDGNCTVSGNALYVARGANVVFDTMQVECPLAFTGNDNACISLNHSGGGLVFNTKITNNSINTQGNPLYCVYLQETDQTLIDLNMLYCDGTVGSHIYIDSLARNTVIGKNKYFDSVSGVEIEAKIIDKGIGTIGIWKPVTLQNGWVAQNTPSEPEAAFYKGIDGSVRLRGRIIGPSSTPGVVVATLPAGFRPKAAILLGSIGVQIIPDGTVQIIGSGQTEVFLSEIEFSTL